MMRALVIGLLALCCASCLEPNGQGISFRDTHPPRLIRTIPEANGLILRDGDVRIIFSEPMDARSLEAGVVLLAGDHQEAVTLFLPPEGNIPEPVQPEAPYTVRLKLASGPWPSSVPYMLVLRTLLTDTAGNALETEVQVPLFSAP